MMNKPELLLPAGDLDTAKRAIDHGADAVYVGLDRFSARAKATNLSLAEMREAIEYAHARGAKIFCALNILLFNDELEDAIKAVAELVGFGIDAFIVQDFGLATLLLSHFPETEVHASTQMAVMNVCGAETIAALGFDRVVLARETSLEMMQAIRAASSIDLEVFVQGALCVSYSGLCYMSSLAGDRSGNRGQCAQPCRRRYALVEGDGKKERRITEQYLLSPKDMNLLGDLSALMNVPVQSLKIEGRMKQPEYVALMADVYRKHIDRIAAGLPQDDAEMAQDLRNMAVVFNREGFSTAYLHGVPGCSMMSLHTPKNTGIPLGEIVRLTKSSCSVRLAEPLANGDGVALYDATLAPIWGGYLDQLKDERGETRKAFAAGEVVSFRHTVDAAHLAEVACCYKTFDKELSKSLLKMRSLPLQREEKGTLHFYVSAVPETPFAVDVLCESAAGESLSYHWASDYVIELSRNGRSSREVIEGALHKLANTGYHAGTVEISGPDAAFVPMSVVTKAKNAAVAHFDAVLSGAELEQEEAPYDAKARVEECLSVLDEIPPQIRFPHTPTLTVQVRTAAQAEAALAAGAEELNVLLLDSHTRDGLTDAEVLVLAERCPLLVSLPPLIKTPEEEAHLIARLQALHDGGITRFMVANIGQIKLVDDLGIDFMAGDYQLNLTNDLTAAALSQIGLSRQTISIEMDHARMQELSAIGTIPLELVIYGRLPAMNTRCCPMGNSVGARETDQPCTRPCVRKDYALERDGRRYALVGDRFCNVYILNDRTYSLLGHLKEIAALSLDYWRIAGAFMTPQEISGIVQETRALRAQILSESDQQALHIFQTNTTDGHFVKGVR